MSNEKLWRGISAPSLIFEADGNTGTKMNYRLKVHRFRGHDEVRLTIGLSHFEFSLEQAEDIGSAMIEAAAHAPVAADVESRICRKHMENPKAIGQHSCPLCAAEEHVEDNQALRTDNKLLREQVANLEALLADLLGAGGGE